MAPRLSGAGQQPEPAAPGLVSWVVYWLPEASLEGAARAGETVDEINVFAYQFDERGRLIPATPWVDDTIRALTAKPRDQRPRVLVSVVNDVMTPEGARRLKDARMVHEMVATPEALERHVEQLAAVAGMADGLEIDYENLRAQDRQAFSQLVERLAARLHAQGKWLSVVVQARLHDSVKDGAGAIDWRAVGRSADSVKLMAYYYHHGRGRPGPSAPPEWVVKLHRFASTQVPPEKLVTVISAYGFDWPDGQVGKNIGHADAAALAEKHGASPERDGHSATLHFEYQSGAVRHEVWYEDPESFARKVSALRDAGARRIGVWHVGAGLPLVDAVVERLQ